MGTAEVEGRTTNYDPITKQKRLESFVPLTERGGFLRVLSSFLVLDILFRYDLVWHDFFELISFVYNG
jgi:hypothetical protein